MLETCISGGGRTRRDVAFTRHEKLFVFLQGSLKDSFWYIVIEWMATCGQKEWVRAGLRPGWVDFEEAFVFSFFAYAYACWDE
jgi:hypothetical protein